MRFVVLAALMAACAGEPLSPPTGDQVRYVISDLRYPHSNTQARELGFELYGDNNIDNQLGMVFSTIGGMGIVFDARVDERIGRGDVLTLAMVQHAQASDPSDSIAITLYDGRQP
jgi:hypothetical protein